MARPPPRQDRRQHHTDTSLLVAAIQTAIDQTTLKGRVTASSDSSGMLTLNSTHGGRLSSLDVSGNAARAAEPRCADRDRRHVGERQQRHLRQPHGHGRPLIRSPFRRRS